MKTIFIAHNYSLDSFNSMSYCLANFLAHEGNNVVFISHKPYFQEVEVKHLGKGQLTVCSWPSEKRPTSLNDLYWYIKLHLKYKPDTVIGHFVGSNISILGSKMLSLGRVKTFEYYHTLRKQLVQDSKIAFFKDKFLFYRKKIFYHLFCDVLICPSELAKKDLFNYFKINRGIVLLNPMVDRLKFNNKIIKESIIIAYLGRIDSSKGVLDLVEAFLAYRKRITNSKIVLKIAGTGSEVAAILNLIKNRSDVLYLGGIDYVSVDEYLRNSHYVIISSKFDNLPTVGIEAMMNKTPLLISKDIGLSNYLTEGQECFKFSPCISDMIEIFEKVENSFFKHEEMAIKARNTFEKYFTIETYCKNFKELICVS